MYLCIKLAKYNKNEINYAVNLELCKIKKINNVVNDTFMLIYKFKKQNNNRYNKINHKIQSSFPCSRREFSQHTMQIYNSNFKNSFYLLN